MKRLFLFAFLLFFGITLVADRPAEAASSGSLIKASGPAVYYVWEDRRYVFPNEHIYFSWYDNFDQVETVSDSELATFLIGGNVTYKPGTKLVKIQTDPKVYAVGAGGTLRWITSEEVALALYGPNWNKEVHDVSDAYFLDYRQGDAIAVSQDFDVTTERASVGIFEDLRARDAEPDDTPKKVSFRAVENGNWLDRTTWEDSKIPGSGAEVLIPVGIEVVYNASESGHLKVLNVDGALIFDPTKTTKLTAKMISVGGRLAVGTEEEPIGVGYTATIQLTGASNFTVSDDGLRVAGLLEMHGQVPETAWTRLASGAEAGTTEILLEDEVAWNPGDRIAIASGTRDPGQTEIRTITEVEGALVKFETPLTHMHRADDMLRSEVGLLTRNVRMIGTGEGQGSYVSMHGRAQARIVAAEFEGLGRTGVAGHYALYFDGLGNASDSYLRSSSIHDSGNRCATLRQTHSMEVSGLVAAGVRGHCIATAEGAETDLLLKDNLIMGVMAGDERTDDLVPSGMLLRNPDMTIEGNVIAGSEGYGYWYDLPQSVVKSDGSLLRPRETALASFSGNTAHSSKTGLFVDDLKGEMNYSPSEKAVFTGYSGVLNDERGFWLRGSNLEISNAYLGDNRIGGTFSAFGAELKDSLVVGNPGGGEDQFGFTYLDGPVSVTNVTFRDFVSSEERQAAAFSFHAPNEIIPDPRNSFSSVTFENADAWYAYPPAEAGDYLSVVRDLDNGTTLAARDLFLNVGCTFEDGDTVMTCPGNYPQVLVIFRDAPGTEDVRFERLDTNRAFTLHKGPSFDGKYAYMTLAEGPGYRVTGPTTRSISVITEILEPMIMRFEAPNTATVRVNGAVAEQKPWPDLEPKEYGYDESLGEVVVNIPQNGFVDITW